VARVKDVPHTWEEAEQFALAVAALHHGKKPAGLDAFLQALAFPKDSESPAGFKGPFSKEKDIEDTFKALRDALSK
jgi:hypothetical protein